MSTKKPELPSIAALTKVVYWSNRATIAICELAELEKQDAQGLVGPGVVAGKLYDIDTCVARAKAAAEAL